MFNKLIETYGCIVFGADTLEEKQREIELENAVRDATLVDNTAQSIFTYLKEVENKREVYEKRWIWELLQNALDAAKPDGKIQIQIIKSNNQLSFLHDGRPFKKEEISHLIYHGSTKSQEDVGKFGTGFLITHLLSRTVNVSGIREDGKNFAFQLNRNGFSFQEIKALMEDTWNKYLSSLKSETIDITYNARMDYPLNPVSSKTVDVGLNELQRIAPYVLSFNDKIKTISIINGQSSVLFELISENLESCFLHKTVSEKTNSDSPVFHEVWIARDSEVEIAIKGKTQDGGICYIDSLVDVPKIFVAFPLFATQDLPFPAVVNSRKFIPGERRDGIFLGVKETEDIKLNKRLLGVATNLFVELLTKMDCSRWNNIHAILGLVPPPEKEWLDKAWYSSLLSNLIVNILPAKILRTENSSFISLNTGFVPVVETETENIEKLWTLCSSFSCYKDKLPAKNISHAWAVVISGWKALGLDFSLIKISAEDIAQQIQNAGTLEDLKNKLIAETSEVNLINEFGKYLLATNKKAIFDNSNILPDQNGSFKTKKLLFKDEVLDEDLKMISKELGEDIRGQLLSANIENSIQSLLPIKKQEELIGKILVKVKPDSSGNANVEANVDFFSWLLKNKIEYLTGYPVLTLKEKTFSTLSKEKERLLAPKELWNEKAKTYHELFPQDGVISSLYFEKVNQKELWNALVSNELILMDPLFLAKEKVHRNELELYVCSQEKIDIEKTHEIPNEIEVSKIAFLETTDKGIMSTTRNSREKCRKFLNFVFDYVIEQDKGKWDNILEIDCECGFKHKIYPAQWVSVLKGRQWVPAPKDKPLTSANLAVVLSGQDEILKKCRQEEPSKLLNILNTSVGELMMNIASKNDAVKHELDKAMGSLFSTFMAKPEQLNKLATLAETDSDLIVAEVEKRIEDREKINKNQVLGETVEKLLTDALREFNIKVERTGVGSDFEIDNDYVQDGKENLLDVKKSDNTSILIEIKATYRDYVRMTIAQAKEARNNYQKYALCVVSLDSGEVNLSNVKANVKFVLDIGEKIREKVIEVENHELDQAIVAASGDIEIELNEGPIKFRINKSVWNNGMFFEQFITKLKG